MAGQGPTLQHSLSTVLKYFLVGISLTLFIVLSQGEIGKAGGLTQQQAQQLTQKGHALLHQGRAAEALATWEEATKTYQQLRNAQGVTGSSINQSLALQALGLYSRACNILSQALHLDDWVCSSPIQMQQITPSESGQQLNLALQKQPFLSVTVIGLQNLGDVLRLLGKPDESEIVLQKAVAMAKSLTPEPNINEILLSLANTERTLYSQARNKYQITEEPIAKEMATKTAQSKARIALNLYQQVAEAAGKKQNSTALQAQLNRLNLLLELGQQNQYKPEIQPLLKQLLTADFSQLPTIQSVYAQLNFANSLIKISQNEQLNKSLFPTEKKSLLVALPLAQTAWQSAQKLNHHRAESYALGTIGNIYTNLKQATMVRQYLEKALAAAQSVQAWDIAYQWQQQLGYLYKLSGNLNEATEAYAAAINSLEQVRGNILSVNPDIQFYFKEKVEPVYREYMELLLAEANPNLEQVLQTNEQLQLAQLENFLQCGKLELVSLSEVQNSLSVPTTVHLINLGKQVEVIVRSPGYSFYRHTVDTNSVRKNGRATGKCGIEYHTREEN